MQSGRAEEEATGTVRVSLSQENPISKVLTYFPHIPTLALACTITTLPCLFNVFHIFLIFFPTTTIARPENISRDPTAV